MHHFNLYTTVTTTATTTVTTATTDFFYLPIVRDVDYRMALQSGGNRNPSIIDNALIEAIEKNNTIPWKENFQITDKYWYRHGGADHVRTEM